MLGRMLAAGTILAFATGMAAGAIAADNQTRPAKLPRLRVTSTEIKPRATVAEEQVANLFGCSGGNISPEVKWSGEPAGTKSFALTIYDPNAPTGSGFWHWVVFNIPADVHELPKGAGDPKAGSMPGKAIQSRTDFGITGYGGPCPPPGDKPHHYRLTVYAVDADHLDGDANTPAAVIGFQLHYHTLAKGTITGLYQRAK